MSYEIKIVSNIDIRAGKTNQESGFYILQNYSDWLIGPFVDYESAMKAKTVHDSWKIIGTIEALNE